MAKQFDEMSEGHIDFIKKQHLFFVATACAEGRVNLSPKGYETLRVIDPNKILWLNLSGSGNETAAHVYDNGRMTLMFCSFDIEPVVLRLYGKAKIVHPRDPEWDEMSGHFDDFVSARQFFEMSIDLVQTSCGFAVPFYEFKGQRETLIKLADSRGREGVKERWAEKNQVTIDGFPTKILGED